MTAAIVTPASPSVNPPEPLAYATSGLRGLTLFNPYRTLGLRFQEVAAFEAAAGRVTLPELAYIDAHAVELAAEIDLKRRTVQTHIQLIQPCSLTSSDFRRLGAESYAKWQHSRLARTESRKRKTPSTCLRCAKLGRACWQHGGAK
jgi:hypothetical protein